MKELFKYIQSRVEVAIDELIQLEKYFIYEEVSSQSLLLREGKIERYVYFLKKGIVKGYQNIDGKIVIQHLVSENDFFTSLDSFMGEKPTSDYYETITACTLIKISRENFDFLNDNTKFWSDFIKIVTNEHLACKLERVKDFQTLSAKKRYLKFVKEHPNLALQVSIDNIASFLGMEPQSLSRIRKEITF